MSENTTNKQTGEVSTKDLKRVLGLGDLLATAIGQVIGAGIMSLTGVAIAMAGKSVSLSFILSTVFVILALIPTVIAGGTFRMRGGNYTMLNALIGPKISGFYIIMFILTNISLAMYGLSFADYMISFLPQLNRQIIAIVVLTLVFITNLTGAKNAAKLQNIIVIVMAAALALFSVFGITKVDFGTYFNENYFSMGAFGMLQAAALLTYATNGASTIINLGAEAKNAKRDIPLAIILSTVFIGLLYAFMSVVASGVLPIETVAGQPLSLVAKEVLPTPLYIFFVVGGAMFALLSTLNAQFQWATKPLMQACVDGWFSPKFAKLHPKYKTPVYLLTFFYIMGLIPILTGLDVGAIGSMTALLSNALMVITNLSIIRIPKVMNEAWKQSKYKIPTWLLALFSCLAIATNLLVVFLVGSSLTPAVIGVNAGVLVFAAAYVYWRQKQGHIHMEVSYEFD